MRLNESIFRTQLSTEIRLDRSLLTSSPCHPVTLSASRVHPMYLLVPEQHLDVVELAIVVPDMADGNLGNSEQRRIHPPWRSDHRIKRFIAGVGKSGAE